MFLLLIIQNLCLCATFYANNGIGKPSNHNLLMNLDNSSSQSQSCRLRHIHCGCIIYRVELLTCDQGEGVELNHHYSLTTTAFNNLNEEGTSS
jgi:hypothetical protein